MLNKNLKQLKNGLKKTQETLPILLKFMQNVEDSGLVNAGIGSNLTSEGQIEMDASLAYVKVH
jgi:isoaspartyl peptidase/L-asparaginase-like protein (Ntn-hydrolase superfamily)